MSRPKLPKLRKPPQRAGLPPICQILTGSIRFSAIINSRGVARVSELTANSFIYGLWHCDHDGNKIKLVRSQEQLDARPIKSIDDRLIYGNRIFESDADTFVVYDMENGEYFTFELE